MMKREILNHSLNDPLPLKTKAVGAVTSSGYICFIFQSCLCATSRHL